MRDRRVYIKTIAISEEDLNKIKEMKKKIGGKKSLAGVLSFIINFYRNYDLSDVQSKSNLQKRTDG
jgi:predicted CopG family antitoxin